MKIERSPTGAPILDNFLNGGYEKGIITTIYGPSSSGKTNLCLLPMIRLVGSGKKVIYIDTESSLSIERLKQITKHHQKVLSNTIIFKPFNFEEQKKSFQNLKRITDEKIGLIIVDTISMLYRLELGKSDDIYNVNASLGQQISILSELARKYNIPVLITNQVYSDFKNKDKINMVGGDLLKYGSKCLIELQNLKNNKRKAILRKHRSLPRNKSIVFEIIKKGIK